MEDAFDDESEPTVTIKEYIEAVEEAELEADLVLGGDEGKECTYPAGYVKRQAIFSCLTCVPAGNAGVCTACSLQCHDGHEVVELWTKRNFRCDCGNSKFAQFTCKLFADKDTENAKNSYNQNFRGLYCTCHRPYPDNDAAEQVEMIQCCICEDWFHENHVGLDSTAEILRHEDGEPLFEDFICHNCAMMFSFLKHYPASIWASTGRATELANQDRNMLVDKATCELMNVANGQCEIATDGCTAACSEPGDASGEKVSLNGQIPARALDFVELSSDNGIGTGKCFIQFDFNTVQPTSEKKPLFLSKRWRRSLCTCKTCGEFYAKKGIDYLLDKEDSMEEYERIAKERRAENLEKQEGAALNFLDGMGHIQKIEVLNGIADMRDGLLSFMESFDSSRTITEADVRGFFENLSRKRRRLP